MFRNPKMSSKPLKYALVIVVIGVISVAVLYGTGFVNTCQIRQLETAGDIKKYDQTKDPEFCAQLNEKISQFDNECKGDLEILDCG